jgi:hypothetical protein
MQLFKSVSKNIVLRKQLTSTPMQLRVFTTHAKPGDETSFKDVTDLFKTNFTVEYE